MRRRSALVLLTVFLLAASFRVAIVHEYNSSSPDGRQYYNLARELLRAGRFAFGPPPRPLTYSRLPGYPLFVAAVAVRASLPAQQSVFRAAIANVLLDLMTALILVLLVHDLGLPSWNRYVAVILVALCPLMFLFAVYFLTESLATFLGTLSFWLAVRSHQRQSRIAALASGAAVGAGMLVRADMVTLTPALLVLVMNHSGTIRERLLTASLLVAGTGVVVAPWAIRNVIQFGRPHITAAEWPADDGEPLLTGPMQWMRTWAAGRPGDGDLSGKLVFRAPLGPDDLRPIMYDSPDERRELLSMFEQYRREGLTAAVNERFVQLAKRRITEHPARILLTLPILRAMRLFDAPPRSDYPIRVGFLGLPKHWNLLFATANWITYLLAIGGLVILSTRSRTISAAIALAVGCRVVLHMWAVPTFVCQRYLIEVMPLLLLLATIMLGWSVGQIRTRLAAFETAA